MVLNQEKKGKCKRKKYIAQYIKLNKSQLACYDKITNVTIT